MATSPRPVDNNYNIKSISFLVTHGPVHHASLGVSLMRPCSPPPRRPGGVGPSASAEKPQSPRPVFTLHRALYDGRPGSPGADGRLPNRPRCGRVYD